jgi:PAS domain S-box-containing protein
MDPHERESVSVAEGVSSPWMLVGHGLVVLIVFVVEATVTVWRRAEHRQAILVGFSMVFFVLVGMRQVILTLWGIVHAPLTPSLFYMGIVGGMAYELSDEVLRAAKLSHDLRESEQRMDLAPDAASTARKRGEEALRASEERYRAFIANSSESIWRFDFDAPIPITLPEDQQIDLIYERCFMAECNAEMARLYGFPSVDEAIGVRLATVMPRSKPENVEFLLAFIRARYRLTDTESVEFDLQGNLRRFSNNLVGIVENGVLLGAWGVSRNITEQKRVEERSRLVVEASPSAMVMVNSEGIITLVNAQTETVFGYTRMELIGRSIELFVPERYRARHPHDRHGYVADPTTRAMGAGRELFGRRKDGSEVPVEIGLNPIRTPEGLFVLASIVDITERKRAELEALRQRSELAHLSRVTMLGELSGSMAHELNQPLTAILSNAQAAIRFLAHEHVDLDEVRDILTDIVDQDNRAGEIIRRLRLLLKKGEVQQQPLGLNDLVQEVLKLIRSDLVNQGVTMHTELAPALPTVNGDRVQLQQVLLNLVMNACAAMNGNAPADRQMVVCTELSDGERVRVSVSDRGAGIASDKLEQVFEPFFTTKTHGLGLGLSVCRTIIVAHGGKLWAANNPERGATFHFTLPVRTGAKP